MLALLFDYKVYCRFFFFLKFFLSHSLTATIEKANFKFFFLHGRFLCLYFVWNEKRFERLKLGGIISNTIVNRVMHICNVNLSLKVQLNLFLVFVLNYLSYNFNHFCENVFNFGLLFFVSYYFEIRESFHHFGLWPCH